MTIRKITDVKTVIETYLVGGRRFTIVTDGELFLAIEDIHIDKDGRLKRTLCGPQMYPSRTLEECMDMVKNQVEIQRLTGEGMDMAEAFCRVMGLPITPEIREAFAAAANR